MREGHAASILLALLTFPALGCAPATQPADAGVRAFLNRYFSTWSARDMDGYAACFHPQATVTYLAADGKVFVLALPDFLKSQKLAHEQAKSPMNEKPIEMTIHGDDFVRQASVTWVLTLDGGEQRGTDFFTLKRDGDDWKIVALVFYGK